MTELLQSRIAAQIRRRGDAPCLRFGGAEIGYRRFAGLVDEALAALEEGEVGSGEVVAWLSHNAPQTIAVLLACARRQAVFTPLNWRLAAPELAAIIRHAAPVVVQGSPDFATRVGEALTLAMPPGEAEPAQPGDLLLVYTSGTTGEPKGAMHTHAGLLANIDAAIAVQQLTEADRVLAVLPLFHVGGLCIQVLPALAAGAVVDLHPRFDADAWFDSVASWRPTTSLLVPAVMRALIEHPRWADADLSCLRFVNSGSSIVPVALIEAFHARGVPVAQVYGATETGPVSIALPPEKALANVGAAGWPAPGVAVRLADERGQPVAQGAVGEIQLRAANLMRGYHREPPASGFTADGWFATGDLACCDADGAYTVVGRSRELIISGGENIYPAEIENLAIAWPGVAEAAVVGRPDERWGEVPVLALVAMPGATIDIDGLAAHLQARLARYKQPRRIAVLPALPKTALGKVQKAGLRAQLSEGGNGVP